MKHLKHLKHRLATCAFKRNIYLLLGRKRRIVDASLTAAGILMPRSGAEVTGVELVSGMDLDRGHGKWMECGRNRRRESGRGHAAQVKSPNG